MSGTALAFQSSVALPDQAGLTSACLLTGKHDCVGQRDPSCLQRTRP
jgi:hypothetical protein